MSNLKRRLEKIAGEEFIYIAKGPIKFFVISSYDSYEDNYEGVNHFDDLKAAVDDDMKEMSPSGLAQYISGDLEDGLITSIIVGVDMDGKNVVSKTTIKATRELNSEELEKLEDYLTGQYSDGWGESREQHPIAEWEENVEDEVYDEIEDNYYRDDYMEKMELCAHFWYSGINLKIEKA